MKVEVRLLRSHDEFAACERIQLAVWGSLGAGSEVLSVTQKYGGVVLGAAVNGKIAGFLYAFLARRPGPSGAGRRNGRPIHWSHMMAVLPGYRDLGLGLSMKLAHRRLALKRGIKSICWTFDPLESRNAALNLARLGARVEEYVPDCYGHFQSLIEKGLASDRFVVNWRIASREVERALRARPARAPHLSIAKVSETQTNARGLLENRRISLGLRAPRLLVEIPSNTDEIRARDISLGRRWRAETRRIFVHYLGKGYRVRRFYPPCPPSGRCYYLLTR